MASSLCVRLGPLDCGDPVGGGWVAGPLPGGLGWDSECVWLAGTSDPEDTIYMPPSLPSHHSLTSLAIYQCKESSPEQCKGDTLHLKQRSHRSLLESSVAGELGWLMSCLNYNTEKKWKWLCLPGVAGHEWLKELNSTSNARAVSYVVPYGWSTAGSSITCHRDFCEAGFHLAALGPRLQFI